MNAKQVVFGAGLQGDERDGDKGGEDGVSSEK